MQEKEYNYYNTEDFIWDENFRKWVIDPQPSSDKFWKEWLLKYPANRQTIFSAKAIIKAIQIKNIDLDSEQVQYEIDGILNEVGSISERSGNKLKAVKTVLDAPLKKAYYFLPLKIAAVIIVMTVAAISLYYFFNSQKGNRLIAADYGTIKEVVLPDSTIIILNGNSNISFPSQWKKDQPREIWLDGEGYFNVRHLNKTRAVKAGERFIVHVKNINVEVLGTTFDIRQRRDKIIIVLNTGSIKVYGPHINTIIMVPGDLVAFSAEQPDSVTVSKVESKDFSSWTEKKLMVTNASVKEIFQYLEDNYGKSIVVQDQSVMDRKIEGTIMLDNLDDALFVLSKVLNVKIVNNSDSILIKNK